MLIDVLDADDQNPLFDAGDGYDARLPQPARKVRFQLVAFFFFLVFYLVFKLGLIVVLFSGFCFFALGRSSGGATAATKGGRSGSWPQRQRSLRLERWSVFRFTPSEP